MKEYFLYDVVTIFSASFTSAYKIETSETGHFPTEMKSSIPVIFITFICLVTLIRTRYTFTMLLLLIRETVPKTFVLNVAIGFLS